VSELMARSSDDAIRKGGSASGAQAGPARRSAERVESLNVLVVDDEPAIRRMAALVLTRAGHGIAEAASAEEALELLARDRFDAVVSDLLLGDGQNGWSLAAAVRQRWPATRFVLASACGDGIDSQDARARGVAAVVGKPYLPDELLGALSG
jgi:CheY-like chemotaxis protein